MKNLHKAILILSFSIIGSACQKNEKPGNLIPIHRYEEALFNIPSDSIKEGLTAIQDEYPLFLGGANLNDSLNILQIANFIGDPLVQESYLKIQQKFGDLSLLRTDLSKLFDHYARLYPEEKIPIINTYISNFDYENRIIYIDTLIAISLDLYLGANEPNYSAIGLPQYISRRLSPEYIQIDIAKLLALKKIPITTTRKTLLDEFIYRGKMMYLTDLFLPQVSDDQKIAYTPEQLQWCKDNELAIWEYLIQEQMLYESNHNKIKYYINEGPGNLPFAGAPARLGEWIGWQIVRKYAKKHTGLSTLLQQEDAQTILKESGYKGK